MLDRVIKNSNVVINMVGPRKWVKELNDMERINIDFAKRVAKVLNFKYIYKACARNPNVIRLI